MKRRASDPVLLATRRREIAGTFGRQSDNFARGVADVTQRTHGGRTPWLWYRQTAAEVGSVVSGSFDLIPVEGGGATPEDDPHSWWFGNASIRRSGMLAYKVVGPGATPATPRDFSVRARLTVSNEAVDGPPPGGGGIFTFAGIAIHDPDRSVFCYDHAAMGTEPGIARGYEIKTTQNDVSTFPVNAAGDGEADTEPLVADVRLDRIGQTVAGYFRHGHGTPLEDDSGFVLHTTCDHTTGAPGTEVQTLPDTVHVGFMAYSNVGGPGSPSGADVRLRCSEIVFLPV